MKKLLLAAAVILIGNGVQAQDGCSNWRWQVKNLVDDSGIDWENATPVQSAISQLIYNSTMAFEPEEMDEKHAKMERMESEKDLVALTCYVYDVKTDYKNGEYHLFLSSRKDGGGKQMDAKIPNTDCKGLRRYPRLRTMYDQARKEADIVKSWTDDGYVVKVDLKGVPFRNYEYESRDNVYRTREIHPVIYLKAHVK